MGFTFRPSLFLNDSMVLLAAYIIFLLASVIGSIGFGVVAVCELVHLYRVQTLGGR